MARENNGATPLARLAELDSGMHHVREQTDRDRRAQAARNLGFEAAIQRIDLASQTNAIAVAGIVASLRTVKWMLMSVLPAAIGVAWSLGRLLR